MTLRVGLTRPALAQELKLTWMDYLLTMLRNRLRRKHGYDRHPWFVTNMGFPHQLPKHRVMADALIFDGGLRRVSSHTTSRDADNRDRHTRTHLK